jgi:cytidine deaminase
MSMTQAQRTELIERARAVRRNAYAPYSSYPVGAAVLSGSGAIYDGVNVENAAYPSGMCAERSAVFAAISNGERQIVAVAVVTEQGGTPCGGCRQVLWEFGPQARVIIADADGRVVLEAPLADLLPNAFGPDDLHGKD